MSLKNNLQMRVKPGLAVAGQAVYLLALIHRTTHKHEV